MVANVQKAATIGDHPWWVGTAEDHGQWTDLGDGPVTSETMLEKGGGDYEVMLAPLRADLRLPDGKRTSVTVPKRFAVVRLDTRKVLASGVSNRIELVQNRRSFAFFDEVIGEGQAVYHTSGVLGEGERVWVLAKLPETVNINGVDQIDNYILMVNSHDGSGAFHILFTKIRVVCENTFMMAVGTTDAQQRARGGYRLPHFKGINGRMSVEQAREALGLAHDHMAAFTQEAQIMAQKAISDDEVDGFLQRVFPIPQHLMLEAPRPDEPLLLLPEPKAEDLAPDLRWKITEPRGKRQLVKHLVYKGKGNDNPAVAGTRWAALNGVVEYTDYLAGWDRTRTKSLLFGDGRALKQKAWNILSSA